MWLPVCLGFVISGNVYRVESVWKYALQRCEQCVSSTDMLNPGLAAMIAKMKVSGGVDYSSVYTHTFVGNDQLR